MISKTKIKKRLERKKDTELIDTVKTAGNNEKWKRAAAKISGPRKNYVSVNLSEIEKQTKEGDTVVILGKVLGSGNINKKVRVCAMSFSESAREKLLKNKGEAVSVLEEVRKNPKAEGVKILG